MAVKKKRSELVAAIRAGFQRVSGQSVVLSAIIAEKFGLAPSDLECLGFLQLEGPLTAGRLAELGHAVDEGTPDWDGRLHRIAQRFANG